MTVRAAALPVLLAAAVALPAGAAAASPWSAPASFPTAGTIDADSAAPRIAIAADGTSVAAWIRGRDVAVSTGGGHGRFTRAAIAGRWRAAAPAVAAGPGGQALVAWEDGTGIRVRVRAKAGARWTTRLAAPSTGSAINGVEVARVGRDRGWIVAERQFPAHGSGVPYRVRALWLDPDGRRIGDVQDLGLGSFGLDARVARALTVSPGGRATLVYTSASPGAVPATMLVAHAPVGGPFGAPVSPTDGAGHGTLFAGSGGLVASLRTARCGDAGCTGTPEAWRVDGSGALEPLGAVALDQPGRALRPSVAPIGGRGAALVFGLKDGPLPFATQAPVRAVALAADGTAGPLQTLTGGAASEPVALPLSGSRVLAIWAGTRGWGAALAGPDGRFAPFPTAPGPPPTAAHTNATNRDVATAGRYVAIAWARGHRVRMSVARP
ncbi:MAG TPA: hypothetical protein VGM33_24010 [Baekduia sp.]|jgi:hypothetical protein